MQTALHATTQAKFVPYPKATPQFSCFMSHITTTPSKIKVGIAMNEEPKWVIAINEELDALEVNHTWDITDIPQRTKAIGNNFGRDGSLEILSHTSQLSCLFVNYTSDFLIRKLQP